MGCRCLSVCPCETTVPAPGTASREPVLTAWRGRGHRAGLAGVHLGQGLVTGSAGLPGILLGPSALSASLAQLLLSEKSSMATRCPTAPQGLGLQVGTLRGHPHPTHVGHCGIHKAGLEAGAGKVWTPSSPQSTDGQGSRAAPRLLTFPWCCLCCCSPEALGLLLGVLHIPRTSARITPCSGFFFFGEVSGVCEVPGGTPSSTVCCKGGRRREQGRDVGEGSDEPDLSDTARSCGGTWLVRVLPPHRPGQCHHTSLGNATTLTQTLPSCQLGHCHHASLGQRSNSLAEQPPGGGVWQRPDLVGNGSAFIRIFPTFSRYWEPWGRLTGPTQLAPR